jgi:hypothetical protein
MSWQDGDVEGNQRSVVGSIDSSLFHDYDVLNMSISKARSVVNNTITRRWKKLILLNSQLFDYNDERSHMSVWKYLRL